MNELKLSDEQKAAICRLATTGAVAVVEFRGQKPHKADYTDKKTGQKKTFQYIAVACENAATGEQIMLENLPPRGHEGEQAPLQLQRGDLFVAVIEALKSERGAVSGRFQYFELLNGASVAAPARDYKLAETTPTGKIVPLAKAV